MSNEIEKTREFRIEQSREKLDLSSIMLKKELYNDSFIFSYLSMFYSVRILLIGKEGDSDDHNKILELVKQYYKPSGWIDVNIIEILQEAKTYKEKIDNEKGIVLGKEDAQKFNKNASLILDQVFKMLDLPQDK